jgi:inosose dehydratase
MENVPPPPEYSPDRVLEEIVEAGYSGTELGPYGFLPTTAPELCAALEKRRLTLCSAFVEFDLGNITGLQDNLTTLVRSAKLISAAGAKLLVLSDAITPDRNRVAGQREAANQLSWTNEEWQNVGVAVGRVIQECQALGLRVAFHHHVGTHVETPEEVDRLFGMFPTADLGLCLDTGHYVYGGGDVLACLEKFAQRVWCVHLKDICAVKLHAARSSKLTFHDAVRTGVFPALGKGNINFPEIISRVKRANYSGWFVVEADVLPGGQGANSPLPSAIAARQFLRCLGL